MQVLILDFGSQYTQLIARRVREAGIYCEIHPYTNANKLLTDSLMDDLRGIILSGSPCSVNDQDAPDIPNNLLNREIPILGICYGAQLIAQKLGGTVQASNSREYGRANLEITLSQSILFDGISSNSQVWMSHGDTITSLPEDSVRLASTETVPNVAFQITNKVIFGIQFHPEVTHTLEGAQLLSNFLFKVCRCNKDWSANNFVAQEVHNVQAKVQNDKVVLGLSGGVDSSVVALLLHKAIGKNLHCIFVDSGLLRKNEFQEVLHSYQDLGLNVQGINAKEVFFEALAGLSDPEAKRKAIGKTFIEVFEQEAKRIEGAKWLAQGTIYPDVIESVSVKGPSVTIKSHHNVGGLPEKMKLQIIEPLRMLFKDEVRKVGAELSLPLNILHRHPFPGPGLAIRILGDITEQKVKILQEADAIFIEQLKISGWYDRTWQAGVILLNAQSVGVMGDERTYENVVALRAVSSTDGMTADWVHLPYELLATISNEIINKVRGVNRVVYDISSKPPATIEWE